MTVYAVRDAETGLYRYDGIWAAEPEWYMWEEAKNIIESSRMPQLTLEPYELTREDME